MARMRATLIAWLTLFLAAGASAQGWLAQGFAEGGAPSALHAPAPTFGGAPPGVIGPDQAAAIARAQTGGRVLDVQQMPDGRPSAYAVRILLDAGRVRTVVVDGQSGQLR